MENDKMGATVYFYSSASQVIVLLHCLNLNGRSLRLQTCGAKKAMCVMCARAFDLPTVEAYHAGPSAADVPVPAVSPQSTTKKGPITSIAVRCKASEVDRLIPACGARGESQADKLSFVLGTVMLRRYLSD